MFCARAARVVFDNRERIEMERVSPNLCRCHHAAPFAVAAHSCLLANMRARISHAAIENHSLLFYNQTVFGALLPFISTFEHILSHILRRAFLGAAYEVREISVDCISCGLWWPTIKESTDSPSFDWNVFCIGCAMRECVTINEQMKPIRSMRMCFCRFTFKHSMTFDSLSILDMH